MSTLLIVLIAIFLVTLWINFIKANDQFWSNAYLKQRQDNCRPHKWTYDETGHMICKECKFKAGLIISDDDN